MTSCRKRSLTKFQCNRTIVSLKINYTYFLSLNVVDVIVMANTCCNAITYTTCCWNCSSHFVTFDNTHTWQLHRKLHNIQVAIANDFNNVSYCVICQFQFVQQQQKSEIDNRKLCSQNIFLICLTNVSLIFISMLSLRYQSAV